MIHKIISVKPEGMPEAKLHTYFWEDSKEAYPGRTRPVILIFPGGGYGMTSDREAEGVALRFMSMGYHTAVLRYAVAPERYPAALLQAYEAIKILRARADEWLIEQDKIIVQGFSAGGHLAASTGVFWNEAFIAKRLGVSSEMVRPNGLILNYPVITSGAYAHRQSFRNLLGRHYDELVDKMSLEHQVGLHTPKTFIWHTFNDETVPVENALLFVKALCAHKVPVEFHLYPDGVHGLSLANELTMGEDGRKRNKECASWHELAETWLKTNFGCFS